MAKKPRELYHFTCHAWWRFIQGEGITRGECPISLAKALNFPNLTTDPEPSQQGWSRGSIFNKSAVRITVKLRPSDPLLVQWLDFARQHGMTSFDLHHLRNGAGDCRSWWIYRGPIGPSRFASVDVLQEPDARERQAIEILDSHGAKTSRDAIRILKQHMPVKLPPGWVVASDQN